MNDRKEIPGTLPEWLTPHVEEVAEWGTTTTAHECWVADCERDAHLHGLCKPHFMRARRQWNPAPSDRPTWKGGES
ncbi:hypothetical protein [Microbacterium sp. CIAB417]|uniref:hypothetical protein n=1 Tax=Microbacterium sp. CIAB417 TaxID=2860287 RepID=UPI001FAE5D3B|nr:hypothetical protein [Microbacterium sp. CIAB417]